MNRTYKSYLVAVLRFAILAIIPIPFLYFITAWLTAGFTSITTFIFYKEYFYKE